MTAWEVFIISIGGNAALLGCVAFFGKSIVSHWLSKDLKSFELALAAALKASADQTNHDRQLAALEHQVRFSKLHERRAEVIERLVHLLHEAHLASSRAATHFNVPQKASAEAEGMFKSAEDSVQSAFFFFDKSRMYLPIDLCERLDGFFKEFRSNIIKSEAYARVDQHAPARVQEEKLKVWIATVEYFNERVPAARRAIEDELRSILYPPTLK